MIILCQCPFCGQVTEVEVTEKAYTEYVNGELAQNAFSDLSATERECIISGICPDCQKSIFGSDDE